MQHSSRYKAVLFDLDGTLVDSFRAIQSSVNHVREFRGLPPLALGAVREAVGNGIHQLLDKTIGLGDSEQNLARFLEHHESVLENQTHVLPGVAESLRALADVGFRLGLCSNKPIAVTRRLLDVLNWSDVFSVVLGPELVANRKPAPDMLLAAIAQLGVAPSDALYVGDMTIDVETGRSAGVVTWVVPTGSHDKEHLLRANPARILDRFDELIPFVVDDVDPHRSI